MIARRARALLVPVALLATGACIATQNDLRLVQNDIAVLTDWRGQLVKHQKQAVIGAAVAGFVIGGGIAAFGGLFRRRRALVDAPAALSVVAKVIGRRLAI